MRCLRIAIVASIVVAPAAAAADTPSVHDELLALADRAAAKWASPAGVHELIEAHIVAGRLDGLGATVAAIEARRATPMKFTVDTAWLAANYAAAGDRAAVIRLAEQSARDLAGQDDAWLVPRAHCALALAWERLGDEALADAERALGKGAFCHALLPAVAARAGRHQRARALLDQTIPLREKVAILMSLADVAADASDRGLGHAALAEAEALLAAPPSYDPDPVALSRLAVRLARIGEGKRAAKAARAAFALIKDLDDDILWVDVEDVAAGLAAARQARPLATLVARIDRLRRADSGSLDLALHMVAWYGDRGRARKMIREVEAALGRERPDSGARFPIQLTLIDAHLALGQIDQAIEGAGNLSVTMQVELTGLLRVARHCREHGCKRTPAVTAALLALRQFIDAP